MTSRDLAALDPHLPLDERAARKVEEDLDADVERALRDPFRFPSWDSFCRFRRRHGRGRPGRPPRHPGREPYAGLDAW